MPRIQVKRLQVKTPKGNFPIILIGRGVAFDLDAIQKLAGAKRRLVQLPKWIGKFDKRRKTVSLAVTKPKGLFACVALPSRPNPKLYSFETASHILKIAEHALRKRVARGNIHTVTLGSRRLIPMTEIARILFTAARRKRAGGIDKPG